MRSRKEQYEVRNVSIDGDLIRPAEALLGKVGITRERVYNRETVRQDVIALRGMYADEGYAYAEVVPRVKEDDETRQVDIIYTCNKGEKVRFERITISGNTTTRDKVIRRELRVVEGDYFSGHDLKRNAENLRSVGLF